MVTLNEQQSISCSSHQASLLKKWDWKVQSVETQGALPAKSSNQEINTYYGCKHRAVCQAYFLLYDSKLYEWKIWMLISISSRYTVSKADHQDVIMANDSQNHWRMKCVFCAINTGFDPTNCVCFQYTLWFSMVLCATILLIFFFTLIFYF